MSVFLPVLNSYSSRQLITLDDVPLSMILTWNDRTQGWTLGFEDRDGSPVLSGRRLVLQIDLLFGMHHLPGVPAGSLFVLDLTNKLRGVGKDDLINGNAVIAYFSPGELDAI
jgi:hypothetical protein